MDPIRVIRGMRDLLPEQTRWWRWMERRLDGVMDRYGYAEIRTPVLEHTGLFARSIGQETDIVAKEMYTFADRDGSSLSLRPEGTAAVVRSFIENNLGKKEPLHRLFYRGPMFRHERPQKGRYRQFYQLGAELFGSAHPSADVEIIEVAVGCLQAIGLTDFSLELNTQGCPVCRPGYREQLTAYLREHERQLCTDCRRRLASNPLRVLDCKQAACTAVAEAAPHLLDHACDDCRQQFDQVRAGLEKLGIGGRLNHRMVRGLDYYNRTTFELLAAGLGAQNAVAGGGRYDGLVESMGGIPTPAVGFAAGLDRIVLLLEQQVAEPERPPLLFIAAQPGYWLETLPLLQQLRQAGFTAVNDVRQGSFKSQLKRADRLGARLVLLLGQDEIEQGTVTIKDMQAPSDSERKQWQVERGGLLQEIGGFLER